MRIAFNVFEMAAGQSVCPYHYENGEEEWIVVLTGRPTVRTPEASGSSGRGTACSVRRVRPARTR